jgi:hypothetical protein
MQEQWRTVADFPDYSVSNLGRVRRDVAAGPSPAGKILKGRVNSGSYYRVTLYRRGAPTMLRVHRLVAAAFLGPAPTTDHQAAHGDGCPTNNHVDNLRWATHTENQSDRVRHGTSNRGERSASAKLNERDVRAIRAEYAAGGRTQTDIGARYGVSGQQISHIVRRKKWAHLPD